MALAIGRRRAAQRAQARDPYPVLPDPKLCLCQARGRSWRHTPAPRLGPNAAQTPRTGEGGHVALGWVPPAHPEPSPAFQSTPERVDPAPSGPGVTGAGAGRSWYVSGKKLDGPRDQRSHATAASRRRASPASALSTPPAPAPSSRLGARARPCPLPAPPPAFIRVVRAINLSPLAPGSAPRLTRPAGAPPLGYALARGAHRPPGPPGGAASGMLAARLVDSPLASSRPRPSPGSRSWRAASFLPKMGPFSFRDRREPGPGTRLLWRLVFC